MGGREVNERLAPGVFKRTYPSGRSAIRVHFSYQGIRCQETLSGLDPDIKNHVTAAERRLIAIKHEIGIGTFNYTEHFPDSNRAALFGFVVSKRTVKDIGDAWLEEVKLSKPHSTYYSYWKATVNFVYPAIGKMLVTRVSPEHLRRMFRQADISAKTAKNYQIPVNAIFQRAMDDGDIDANPFDRVNLNNLIAHDRRRTVHEKDPFSMEEIEKLLEAARQHRPEWANYFEFAVFSGLRTSEIYALQWSDWTGAELHVRRARVEGQVKCTKNPASERTITLLARARNALVRQRELTAFNDEIFWNPTTKKPLTRYEPSQRALDYCCKMAGIRRRVQYQTRHTYASNLLSQGVSPHFVAAQLGHTSPTTTYTHYARWVDQCDPQTFLANIEYGKRR